QVLVPGREGLASRCAAEMGAVGLTIGALLVLIRTGGGAHHLEHRRWRGPQRTLAGWRTPASGTDRRGARAAPDGGPGHRRRRGGDLRGEEHQPHGTDKPAA